MTEQTHTTESDAPWWQDPDAVVEWERFACYCTGTRHYYVREPFGTCPPARVTSPGSDQS